jgi:predicted Zn-dependent protease
MPSFLSLAKRLRPALLAALVLPVLAAGLGGCAQNPATGESVFTGGFSEDQEVRMGRESHPQIVKEFNGEYGSPELKAYVASLGQLLARTSERPNLKFTFTVLNSDIINAFAIPGGYVYITRGLLALADNEAQLAAVLGHEIGHITALHHARRYGDSLLATLGVVVAGAALGQPGADLAQHGALALLQSYSRDNEYEADLLGVRYLSRTGFDPYAMAGFLTRLREDSRLTAIRRGESPDAVDRFNYLATHPAPVARVDRAKSLAAETKVREPMTARDVYLSKIDGMLYGDDPEQGFIRGRDFLHPKLHFAFRIPEGFSMFNTERAVIAFGPDKSRIVFDRAPKSVDGTMSYYLRDAWAKSVRLSGLEAIKVNGLDAATATTTIQTNDGAFDARLVAYRIDLQTIYRFVFLTPRAKTAALSTELRRATYSFRRLNGAEAAALKPHRLRIVTVQPGDTVESLGRRMPFADYQVERFAVLNGLSRNETLRPGQRLKMVVEE